MNGFGFIEYEDAMDARDVVPAFHGSTFMGERMVVQFARGARKREDAPAYHERSAPRPRRTLFRMSITGLPVETSWQVSSVPHLNLESYWSLMVATSSYPACRLLPLLWFNAT